MTASLVPGFGSSVVSSKAETSLAILLHSKVEMESLASPTIVGCVAASAPLGMTKKSDKPYEYKYSS